MSNALKQQDLVVALKLAAHPDEAWTYPGLAAALRMSPSETHATVRRLKGCRLYSVTTDRIARRNLLEFLTHGLWYAFPAEEGPTVRGMPTAWSAAPLAGRLVYDEDAGAVWPSARGTVRGRAIAPLHRRVPEAAADDPGLYELLALVDAARAGRARERRIAGDELAKRLS